jgi:hypothetical protein
MVKFLRYTLLCSILLAPASLLANDLYHNCPQPSEIKAGSQSGTWYVNNPGWIGLTHGKDRGDTAVQSFHYVEWWDYSGLPDNGETECWYIGNKGSRIDLTQGSWGQVAKPTDKSLWKVTYDPRAKDPVLVCDAGIDACHF